MAKKQTIIDKFYLRTFGLGWGICCLVWSIMIFQFWWGNHDWKYIAKGLSLGSGFFEARYSQHLPTVLLLEGQLLPVVTVIIALAMLVLEAIFVGRYFEIPKVFGKYLFLALFIGLNPYNFGMFYFLHYMIPLAFWGWGGIFLLFFSEAPFKWWKLFVGIGLFFLILGSYPPNLALFFVLFLAKRVFNVANCRENLQQVIKNCAFFAMEFLGGVVLFKIAYFGLVKYHLLNQDMYNLTLRPISEIFIQIFPEFIKSILQLFHQHSFMEWAYSLFMVLIVLVSVIGLYFEKKNRCILTLLLICLFLASRFSFLVSGDSTGFAIFRMEYWGRLGIYLFSLVFLLKNKNRVIQNLFLIWCVCVGWLFAITDFDIQKVQALGWNAHEKYQVRLKEHITEQKDFDIKRKYISANFEYPRIRMKYFQGHSVTSEMVWCPHAFNESIVNALFLDDGIVPVVIGVEIKTDILVKHPYKSFIPEWENKEFWKRNPENMKNIRFWLYNEAKGNSVYVDDKYIILVLDTKTFYQKRELVAEKLDD